jgi:phosphoribosylglycinamide formyltransferase-1
VKNHLAIFASGSGTNAEAILLYLQEKKSAEVSLIVTNKAEAGVNQVAKKFNVPVLVMNKEQLNDAEFLLGELKKHSVNWIVLAGFLLMIPAYLVKAFENKMVNIHPALLPKFGGKGMYGKRVHQAVLEAKEQKSGISIHFVTEEYDEGKIIFQQETTIENGETIETLEKKIHQLEHQHYPVIIEKLIIQ